jgi:hypothetical protein
VRALHYCEVELQGLVVEECGKPAGLKVEGRWLCAFHFDALQKALARWVDPDWIARLLRKDVGSIETERPGRCLRTF